MQYLLDTHTILYMLSGDGKLPRKVGKIIRDETTTVLFSAASLWEIAIKLSIGKLDVALDFIEIPYVLIEGSVNSLAIEVRHLDTVSRLPLHHRDPFDRMLVAQCLTEGLTLLSSDKQLDAYGVERIW